MSGESGKMKEGEVGKAVRHGGDNACELLDLKAKVSNRVNCRLVTVH